MAHLLAYTASLREGSLNRRLVELEVEILRNLGAEVTLLDLNDYALPLYNADIQDDAGFPEAADAMKALIEDADGIVIAQPEYNYSIPGHHKNLLDWLSRYRPQPLRGKHAFLSSASPSMVGGNRGLWALRIPLVVAGMHVYPDMFSLAKANEAFGEDGKLALDELQKRLESNLEAFLAFVDRGA